MISNLEFSASFSKCLSDMSVHQTVLFFVLSCIQYVDFLLQFHNLEKHILHKRKCSCWNTIAFLQHTFISTRTQYYQIFLYFSCIISVYKMSNIKNLRSNRKGVDYFHTLIMWQPAKKWKRCYNTFLHEKDTKQN